MSTAAATFSVDAGVEAGDFTDIKGLLFGTEPTLANVLVLILVAGALAEVPPAKGERAAPVAVADVDVPKPKGLAPDDAPDANEGVRGSSPVPVFVPVPVPVALASEDGAELNNEPNNGFVADEVDEGDGKGSLLALLMLLPHIDPKEPIEPLELAFSKGRGPPIIGLELSSTTSLSLPLPTLLS